MEVSPCRFESVIAKQMMKSVKEDLAYIHKSNPGTAVRLARQLTNAGILLTTKKRKHQKVLSHSQRPRSHGERLLVQ